MAKTVFKVIALVLFLSLLTGFAIAATPKTEFNVGLWYGYLNGTMNDGTNNVDIKDTLKLQDSTFIVLGVKYNFNDLWSLGLRYRAPGENKGTTTLGRNYSVMGTTFFRNDTINSKLNVSFLDLELQRNLLRNDRYELNVLLDLKFTGVDFSAVSQKTGKEAKFNQSGIPIPQIGLSGKVNFAKSFDVHAKILYLSGGSSGVTGSVLDGNIGVGWNYNPTMNIALDYQGINMTAKYTDNNVSKEATLNYMGPQLSLNFRF